MPKISLLCSAYNAELYIRDLIKSLLQQTFSDFELLFYDDASTDRTLELLHSFKDPRIKVYTETVNRGQNARLHELLKLAQGEYLGWVDADDLLGREALSYTNLVLDYYPNYGLVYTDHFEMDSQAKILGIGERSRLPYSKQNLLLNFISFQFRLFRRSCYEQVEPLQTHYRVASDYELCLKLSEITDFKHLPLPLYYYRIYADSLSRREYQLQSETCLELIRDALKRRGMHNYHVELFYESGKARYRFERVNGT